MAIKTFGTEILTSADTNTYLANSGLVFVKQQTVGSGVTSIPVTDAFSSTYDNYRIIYAGGTSASPIGLQLRLGASITSYYMAQAYVFYNADGIGGYLRDNDNSSWSAAGGGYPDGNVLDVNLYNPFLTLKTAISSAGRPDIRSGGASYFGMTGFHNQATSYTGFTIFAGAALTGGTITVFGFRKA